MGRISWITWLPAKRVIQIGLSSAVCTSIHYPVVCVGRLSPALQHKIEGAGVFRYNTLQHTSTHCNTLKDAASRCNTTQRTATHCNTMQHNATDCNTRWHTVTHGNTRQHTATHYNTLDESRDYVSVRLVATHCSSLQHTATRCNKTGRVSWLCLYQTGAGVLLVRSGASRSFF